MIQEVDRALQAVIGRAGLQRGVLVEFDAPTRDWAARRSAPTVNAYLYDIHEETKRRDVGAQPIYNEEGRIVGRQEPPRRISLSYLVTAWSQRPEDEHRLLAQLLTVFLQFDQIPNDDLPEQLAAVGVPVLIGFADPSREGEHRNTVELWSALGGDLRPSIDLRVVAPLDAARGFETGPPVLESPKIAVEAAAPATKGSTRRKAKTVRVGADLPAGTEEVIGGDDALPGRTLRVRTFER